MSDLLDLLAKAPPQDLTAHELAAMSFRAGRKALLEQEVRFMTEHRAKAVLEALHDEGDDRIKRVACASLDDDRKVFTWHGFEHPEDKEPTDEFYTDYDGNLVAEEELE